MVTSEEKMSENPYPVYEGYKIVKEYTGFINNHINPWLSMDKIELGTPSDVVLHVMPKDSMVTNPVVLGKDADGYVVEWHYKDVILTLAYVRGRYESNYCVQQIQVKDVNN